MERRYYFHEIMLANYAGGSSSIEIIVHTFI